MFLCSVNTLSFCLAYKGKVRLYFSVFYFSPWHLFSCAYCFSVSLCTPDFHFLLSFSYLTISCFCCTSHVLIPCPHLHLQCTLPVATFKLTRRSQWGNIWTASLIILKIGDSHPCFFRWMCKMFLANSMVGSVKLFWVLQRNVGGIEVVAARQNCGFIIPIPICRVFGVMKRWGMSDALATLLLTSAASVRMTGPSSWTLSSLFHVSTINSRPFQCGHIGRETWTLNFECAAAVVACFLVGIVSKCLRYCLRNVAISTLVAHTGGFHTSAVR